MKQTTDESRDAHASDAPRRPRVGRRTTITAAIAGATAFLGVLGAVPATAAWTAAATATGTATAPKIAVSQSGFDTLTTTFLHSTTDQRGGFTISNTGGAAGTASLTVTASGTLAAGITVDVWQADSLAACANTMPATAVRGTWASFPAFTVSSLAPGASTVVCVRSSVTNPDQVAATSGSQTVSPSATATLASGRWAVQSSPSTATLTTKYFYPLATGYLSTSQNNWFIVKPVSNSGQCLDTFNSSTAVGAVIGVWTCGQQANQRFELYPTQGGNTGIRPMTSAELSVGHSGVQTVLARPSAPATDWRIERVTASTYQIVDVGTGLCLTATSQAQNQIAVCSGTTSQQFTLTRDPLTCSVSGKTLTLDFKVTGASRVYSVQSKQGTGAWTTVFTQNSTLATVASVTLAQFKTAGTGTLDIRVVDSAGNVLYSGMTVTTTATTVACGTGFA